MGNCEKKTISVYELEQLLERLDGSEFISEKKAGKTKYLPGYHHKFNSEDVLKVTQAIEQRGVAVYNGVGITYTSKEDQGNVNTADDYENNRYTLFSVKMLRKLLDMTQQEYSDYMLVPKRTIQNWENGKSECPEYLLILMNKKVAVDFGEDIFFFLS